MSQMRAKRSRVSNRADHMPAEGAAVLSGLPPRDVSPRPPQTAPLLRSYGTFSISIM